MQDKFWTPELWCEFLEGYSISSGMDILKAAEQFKSSKSPKKEWEIVAYYFKPQLSSTKKPIVVDVNSGHWNNAKADDGETFGIHSVRRLSDGEVFSVGDRIVTFLYKIGVAIKRFEVVGDKLNIYHEHGHFYADGDHYYFSTIKKLPQPILTTVDGVEIFDLDNFRPTVVFDDWSTNINADRSLWQTGVNHYGGKLFSSNEVAQKYILENKPLLSLNDVKEALFKQLGDTPSARYLLEPLTALVKQKLNQ